jgi:beta-lactam-binding protein with PASTA domain
LIVFVWLMVILLVGCAGHGAEPTAKGGDRHSTPTDVSIEPTTPMPTTTFQVLPDLRGQTRHAATNSLADRGLRVRIVERASDLPPGRVIGSDPPGGSRIQPGVQVTLVVSKGRPARADLVLSPAGVQCRYVPGGGSAEP